MPISIYNKDEFKKELLKELQETGNIVKTINNIARKIIDQDTKFNIAIIGELGVGKSALINAIAELDGEKAAKTTRNSQVVKIPQQYNYGKVCLVEFPPFNISGYKYTDFLKDYDLSEYDLILNVISNRFYEQTQKLYNTITSKKVDYIIIRSYSDSIDGSLEEIKQEKQDIVEDIKRSIQYDKEVFFVCANKRSPRYREGIPELQEYIQKIVKEKFQEYKIQKCKRILEELEKEFYQDPQNVQYRPQVRNWADFADQYNLKKQELYDQAKKGDVGKVLKILDEGFDPDIEYKGVSLLHIAAMRNDIELAKALIEHGADVNYLTSEKWTPLHIAAAKGHTALVKLLIEKGAKLDVKTKDRKEPLDLAREKGYAEIVSIITDAKTNGRDIDERDENGFTQLYRAVVDRDTELALHLIDLGADTSIKFNSNETVLHIAASMGNTTLVEKLLSQGMGIDDENELGQTPIMRALENEQLDVARLLMQKCANIKKTDKKGIGIVHIAANKGYIDIVKTLVTNCEPLEIEDIEKNDPIDINIRDSNKKTPLHYAVSKENNIDMVQFLIGNGADVNATDKDGLYPIQIATKVGDKESVIALIEAGAATKDKSLLHIAAQYGHVDLVNLYLSKDLVIDKVDKDGDTPLIKAVKNKRYDVADLLLQKKAKLIVEDTEKLRAIHVAAKLNDFEMIKLLVDNGEDINRQNSEKLTPIYIAAKYGNLDLVMKLRQEYSPLEYDKYTLLHVVVQNKKSSKELIDYLIESSVEGYINHKSIQGRTALHMAAASGNLECIEELVQHGANLEETDEEGLTPLALAYRHNQIDIVKLLVSYGAKIETKFDEKITVLEHAKANKQGELREVIVDTDINIKLAELIDRDKIEEAVKILNDMIEGNRNAALAYAIRSCNTKLFRFLF